MDKFKQKLKKEKQSKESKDNAKDKYPQFITDVKSIKENIKIKEILRTVKMNNSMRLKAPPGSKVMCNKDFNEEDYFESSVNQGVCEPLCATNPDVIISKTDQEEHNDSLGNTVIKESLKICENGIENNLITEQADTHHEEQIEISNAIDNMETRTDNHQSDEALVKLNLPASNSGANEKNRDRKLSLDHTILTRQEGLSQSELDLNLIGKSPLERKSSFFRKKMDSFVRNTTEMFRRQNKSLKRRVSMSLSLQSLNENTSDSNDAVETNTDSQQETLGSRTSLQTMAPIIRSTSSLSLRQSGQPSSPSPQSSLAGSQSTIYSGSTLEHSNSIHSLNEVHLKEAMLNSRAISMSSGLDSTYGQPRRKASRSNRVTWIASEGLTNYFRRKIQDEKSKEMQGCQSYQDSSSIPENELYNRKPDTKGRRLSYQRAVSGEDPVLPTKYQDSTIRRKHQISETNEAHVELARILSEFTLHGVPPLQGFEVEDIPDESMAYLLWATKLSNIEDITDWKTLSPEEEARQAVIRELIQTEAEYIKHLTAIVEVFIAAAHAIQDRGKMLGVNTSRLFSNLPDLLNASLHFWDVSLIPMIKDAVKNSKHFDTDLMSYGYESFKNILKPYEKFVVDQSKILEYYRNKQSDVEFNMYLAWCHSQKACNRLQLNDFLVKPMQRLTKYSLILQRIGHYTRVESLRSTLVTMENCTRNFVVDVNRSVRQNEEMEKIHKFESTLSSYDADAKDEEIRKVYKMYAHTNLRAAMLYCLPTYKRHLIHDAELRFRDATKEIEVRAFLLTDMLLVSKKFTKGNHYKLIRPKYMIDKMVQIAKLDRNNRDLTGLAYVMVDDVGSSYASFVLSETSKDPNPQQTLRTFENKVKEAKLTYELTVWSSHNPNREISNQDIDIMAEHTNTKARLAAEEGLIENEARERFATVIHKRLDETDQNVSMSSVTTESSEGSPLIYNQVIVGVSARQPVTGQKCTIVHRTSNVPSSSTSRHSRLSSFQYSTSAQSHDDPAGPTRLLHRPSTSTEHHLPPLPDANEGSPSITFTDSETVSTQQITTLETPPLKTAEETDHSSNTQNSLRVQSQNNVATMIYSLPDLTIEPCTPRSTTSPTHLTASEKMYQSHQEILQRLITSPTQQYLTPDHRGSSYPPPSPTRGSLKRGVAFSYPIKNPPLSKMGHVSSQSQPQMETVSSSTRKGERDISPKPGSSSDKGDKKFKLTSSRRKKRDKCHERNVEFSSRKDKTSDASHRDYSPDPYRKAESSCSSYKDESPGTSYRGGSTTPSHRGESPGLSYRGESPSRYSPQPSVRDESISPCHTDENLDENIVEGSCYEESTSTSASRRDSTVIKSVTPDSNLKDELVDPTGRRESRSSDSIQKEKSLSFSFKEESYDSSHKEESFSLSHKDDTPSVEHKDHIPSITPKSEKIEILEESLDTKKDELTTINSSQIQECHDSSKDYPNKDESPDLSYKTESSSVIYKQDDDNIETNHKEICPTGEEVCQETIEQETTDKQTIEQETIEQETIEQETIEQETTDKLTIEQETIEQETTDKHTIEQESLEQETTDKQTIEQDTVEQETTDKQTIEQDTVEQETTDKQTIEQEKIEQETTDKQTIEQDTIEQETTDKQTIEQETTDKQTIEQDTIEQETTDKQTIEQETLEQETTDKQTIEQELELAVDPDSSHIIEEPCPSTSQKYEFPSSRSSSTHEELSSSTSKGTEAGPSIKYEMIRSSSSSSHVPVVPGPSGRHEPITSQDSVQELDEPDLSHTDDDTSSSSREEKTI